MTVSRADEWRAAAREAALAEAVELELPSGVKILARRPDPEQLAAWGALPLGLVTGGGAQQQMTEQEAQDLMRLSRDLLLYCSVDPRISQAPGPGEIHPRDIPREDWMFILRWAMRSEEVEKLRPFRRGPADGGGGDGGADVRGAAVGDAGDRGSGGGAGGGPGGGGADVAGGRRVERRF